MNVVLYAHCWGKSEGGHGILPVHWKELFVNQQTNHLRPSKHLSAKAFNISIL